MTFSWHKGTSTPRTVSGRWTSGVTLGAGRLAEMFGASQVDTDKFLRTLGWERVAQQELDQIDPDTLAILQAYTDGVNAYLADHKGTSLSVEYGILKLLSPSYQPAPWSPINTLTWAKAMAWDLGGNMDGEIERAQLLEDSVASPDQSTLPPISRRSPHHRQGLWFGQRPGAGSSVQRHPPIRTGAGCAFWAGYPPQHACSAAASRESDQITG